MNLLKTKILENIHQNIHSIKKTPLYLMKSKIVVQQLTVVKNIANSENDFHTLCDKSETA